MKETIVATFDMAFLFATLEGKPRALCTLSKCFTASWGFLLLLCFLHTGPGSAAQSALELSFYYYSLASHSQVPSAVSQVSSTAASSVSLSMLPPDAPSLQMWVSPYFTELTSLPLASCLLFNKNRVSV